MIKSIIENIGGKTIDAFVSIFSALKITFLSVVFLFFPTSYKQQARETLVKQIYFTALEPLALFLFLAFLFGTSILGAIISLIIEYNLQDKIGLTIIKFSINEFAPFFTALFIALHSGAHINVNLMQKKQDNKLETSTESLMQILLPRVLAGMFSTLILSALVATIVVMSGYVFTLFYLNMELNGYIYTLMRAIEPSDLFVFITKTLLFGFLSMFIPVYLAIKSKNKPELLANTLLKNMLKLLVVLFFIEVLSLVLQSL
ncbi:ABC transporter permease [bacterium]|jgi:phospholipid/cholesterol/gamma-HCH transport system permease protein|nr:ABC transporter permease [bacterium]MBU1434099.1 ABC transporter permease [bacterium]MBU1503080.1 ABC transporter permease [bacterium]